MNPHSHAEQASCRAAGMNKKPHPPLLGELSHKLVLMWVDRGPKQPELDVHEHGYLDKFLAFALLIKLRYYTGNWNSIWVAHIALSACFSTSQYLESCLTSSLFISGATMLTTVDLLFITRHNVQHLRLSQTLRFISLDWYTCILYRVLGYY